MKFSDICNGFHLGMYYLSYLFNFLSVSVMAAKLEPLSPHQIDPLRRVECLKWKFLRRCTLLQSQSNPLPCVENSSSFQDSWYFLERVAMVLWLMFVVGFVVAMGLYDDVGWRGDGDGWREVFRRGVRVLQDSRRVLHHLHLQRHKSNHVITAAFIPTARSTKSSRRIAPASCSTRTLWTVSILAWRKHFLLNLRVWKLLASCCIFPGNTFY